MATLTTNVITRAGLLFGGVAASGGGDAMQVGSGMMLNINNSGGGSITVTFAIPAAKVFEPTVGLTSPVITIPAGQGRMVGPIDAATFADPVTGLCSITYSGVTSVTVAAYQLSQP